MHLAEEDIENGAGPTEGTIGGQSWLARYPEIGSVLSRIIPGLVPEHSPIRRAPRKSRKIMPKEAKPLMLYARPHEMFVAKTITDTEEYIRAKVLHINPAGALVKIDLERSNGVLIQAEVPKTVIDAQGIVRGDDIFVRPKNIKVFE